MSPSFAGRGGIRRKGLIAGLGVAAVLVVAGVWAWSIYDGARVSTVGRVDFENELAVPPLEEGKLNAEGVRVFDLAFQPGTTEFVADKATPTWGLNGSFLSPALRAARGERIRVNVTNNLPESTTLHWHGMHLPAAMDGGPHQPIRPGETWSPAWTIDQPAATLWFHPHPHEKTEDHVQRGAAGVFLVDDDVEAALPLPRTYGVDDIPLVVQDRAFDSEGAFRHRRPMFATDGNLGDTILVNGTIGPYFDVTTPKLRLRILNGSTARIYNFGFHDERSFALVASDAGLMESPVTLTRIQLSPGERAEIVVSIEPGEEAILRSYGPELGMDFFSSRMNGGDDTFDILQLRAASRLEASPGIPGQLAELETLSEADAVAERNFDLSGRGINGLGMDMERIDASVTVNTTEVWNVRGGGGGPHNFHIHLVHFRVLSIDGEPPAPELSGWKDTIHLLPGTDYRLIARFSDYADPATPYMFHCHALRHEDQGMMGQFVVVEPGDAGRNRLPGDHSHD